MTKKQVETMIKNKEYVNVEILPQHILEDEELIFTAIENNFLYYGFENILDIDYLKEKNIFIPKIYIERTNQILSLIPKMGNKDIKKYILDKHIKPIKPIRFYTLNLYYDSFYDVDTYILKSYLNIKEKDFEKRINSIEKCIPLYNKIKKYIGEWDFSSIGGIPMIIIYASFFDVNLFTFVNKGQIQLEKIKSFFDYGNEKLKSQIFNMILEYYNVNNFNIKCMNEFDIILKEISKIKLNKQNIQTLLDYCMVCEDDETKQILSQNLANFIS